MKVLKRKLVNSESYWARAQKLIPTGTQCLSKGPTQFVNGVAPKYLIDGYGSHVHDADHNEYIDYGMGLHAVILGYCYPKVVKAVAAQLRLGSQFTLMHPLEVEVSELLNEVIPCADMVRFGKTGSDVTSVAVRLARAYTGRDKVCCCGYHGFADWYIGSTEHAKGVPEATKALTVTFRYNNVESLEQAFEKHPDIATVIMEPVGVIEPKNGFLQKVKDLTHRKGALLIFDEILTGFRFSLGGAQQLFGVTPDLATFGKAMANGMPISALVGKAEVMKQLNEVFFSSTFGGEALSLAAAEATIQEIRDKDVMAYLRKQGKKLKEAYNKIAQEHHLNGNGRDYVTACIGYPQRAVMIFRDSTGQDCLEMKSLFQQEMIKRGILFTGYNAISFSHSDEDVEKTIEAYADSMRIVAKACQKKDFLNLLEGGVVSPVFRSA